MSIWRKSNRSLSARARRLPSCLIARRQRRVSKSLICVMKLQPACSSICSRRICPPSFQNFQPVSSHGFVVRPSAASKPRRGCPMRWWASCKTPGTVYPSRSPRLCGVDLAIAPSSLARPRPCLRAAKRSSTSELTCCRSESPMWVRSYRKWIKSSVALPTASLRYLAICSAGAAKSSQP